MKAITWWTALLAVGAMPAVAGEPRRTAIHDIPWYMEHPTERRTLLRLCESDTAFDRNPDCNNAVTARLRANVALQARSGIWGQTVSPAFWAEHGMGLEGVVQNCQSGDPTLLKPAECDAAAIGLAMRRRSDFGR